MIQPGRRGRKRPRVRGDMELATCLIMFARKRYDRAAWGRLEDRRKGGRRVAVGLLACSPFYIVLSFMVEGLFYDGALG